MVFDFNAVSQSFGFFGFKNGGVSVLSTKELNREALFYVFPVNYLGFISDLGYYLRLLEFRKFGYGDIYLSWGNIVYLINQDKYFIMTKDTLSFTTISGSCVVPEGY